MQNDLKSGAASVYCPMEREPWFKKRRNAVINGGAPKASGGCSHGLHMAASPGRSDFWSLSSRNAFWSCEDKAPFTGAVICSKSPKIYNAGSIKSASAFHRRQVTTSVSGRDYTGPWPHVTFCPTDWHAGTSLQPQIVVSFSSDSDNPIFFWSLFRL